MLYRRAVLDVELRSVGIQVVDEDAEDIGAED